MKLEGVEEGWSRKRVRGVERYRRFRGTRRLKKVDS